MYCANGKGSGAAVGKKSTVKTYAFAILRRYLAAMRKKSASHLASVFTTKITSVADGLHTSICFQYIVGGVTLIACGGAEGPMAFGGASSCLEVMFWAHEARLKTMSAKCLCNDKSRHTTR